MATELVQYSNGAMGGIFLTFDNNAQKKCGFCGESIPAHAGRCPYCGSLLEVTFDNGYQINPDENTVPVREEDKNQDNANQYPNNVSNESPMWQEAAGQQHEQENGTQGGDRANYGNRYIPDRNFSNKYNSTPLSNGLKVFLTAIFILIPGIGQLAGIITAIVFMNSEGDSDRKSFGVALLVLSLILFVFACIGCFVIAIYASSVNQYSF